MYLLWPLSWCCFQLIHVIHLCYMATTGFLLYAHESLVVKLGRVSLLYSKMNERGAQFDKGRLTHIAFSIPSADVEKSVEDVVACILLTLSTVSSDLKEITIFDSLGVCQRRSSELCDLMQTALSRQITGSRDLLLQDGSSTQCIVRGSSKIRSLHDVNQTWLASAVRVRFLSYKDSENGAVDCILRKCISEPPAHDSITEPELLVAVTPCASVNGFPASLLRKVEIFFTPSVAGLRSSKLLEAIEYFHGTVQRNGK